MEQSLNVNRDGTKSEFLIGFHPARPKIANWKFSTNSPLASIDFAKNDIDKMCIWCYEVESLWILTWENGSEFIDRCIEIGISVGKLKRR